MPVWKDGFSAAFLKESPNISAKYCTSGSAIVANVSISLCCSPQSVWTTRLYTWCPSPATANRSALLLSATRPLGTPAFQEPGSTSVCCIPVVGLYVLPHVHGTITSLVINYRNRLAWNYGYPTSFSRMWQSLQWTFVVSFCGFISADLLHQIFLSYHSQQHSSGE